MTGSVRGPATPPAVPTRILEAALPADRRGRSILGDLLEEWHERPRGLRRTAWYWSECLVMSARYALVPPRLPGAPTGGEGSPMTRLSELLPIQDIRHALRAALRAPLVTAVTVLALGVGVAAPTVMYALLVGVTRELPVPEPDALVHMGRQFTPTIIRGAEMTWLRPFLEEDGAGDGVLQSVGAFSIGQSDISGEAAFAERRRAANVTPGVFTTLAVSPDLGRAILEQDVEAESGAPVVVISHALWRERFAEDPAVVGETLRMDGTPHTVVGVMPPGFRFPDDTDVWVPLDPFAGGPRRTAELVGRLAPAASLEALAQRTEAVAGNLREAGLVTAEDPTILAVEPWAHRGIDANGRRLLTVMVLVVSFVLVIACANVAHLFLARALSRRPAMAIRLALGAGRWRVVRRHLVEAGLFAVLGGVVGVGLAWLGVRLLAAGMAPRLAWWMEIRLDPVVGVFAAGCVVLAAVLTALVPALQAARMTRGPTLHGAGVPRATSGRGLRRLTGGLMVGEVALAAVLLVVAGLLTRGALRNLEVDQGFETATVLAASYSLRADAYPEPEDVLAFHRALVQESAARPDVEVAAVASHLPAIFSPMRPVEIEGRLYERPEDRPRTHVVHVSPGFLEALGAAPKRGRDLVWSDTDAADPAVLVNEPFVRRHLEGRDPLGMRIRLAPTGGAAGDGEDEGGGWGTVVGVVPSLGMDNGRDFDETGIYLPLRPEASRSAHLLLGAPPGTDAGTLAPTARAVVAGLDADVALTEAASLAARIAATRDMESLFAQLFAFFGLCGLVLAGVGLYALMSFSVGRRLRELGIRAAMGAGPRRLVWTTMRAGAWQVGLGVLLGTVLGALVAPAFGTLFMGYDPRDPVAYAAVAATLLITGAAATLGPARRASSLDVAEVLRAD